MAGSMGATPRLSFWARQFAPQPTLGQIIFDLAFGVMLPLVCLYLDPGIFRGGLGGVEPILGGYKIVAGTAIGLGLLTLCLWLLIRRPPAFFMGSLYGGAIFAGLLGLVLLPLSLIGLAFGIGVLGFSPFATAFVFLRNGVRAARLDRAIDPAARGFLLYPAGLLISCGGPWIAQWYVDYRVSEASALVLSTDPKDTARGLAELKWFSPVANFDQIVRAYEKEPNEKRRELLAAAYRELTGQPIALRLRD